MSEGWKCTRVDLDGVGGSWRGEVGGACGSGGGGQSARRESPTLSFLVVLRIASKG